MITGETGAGKTMLAHALDLLLGGKPRRGIVRPGAEEAYVEGVFEPRRTASPPTRSWPSCASACRSTSGELVLARRVTPGGPHARPTCRAARCPRRSCARSRSRLLAFFGQHEHRKLMLASAQLEILDAFCGAEHLERARRIRARAWRRRAAIERELEELRGRIGARERDLDFLEFEIARDRGGRARPRRRRTSSSASARGWARSETLRGAAAAAAEALDPQPTTSPRGGALLAAGGAGAELRARRRTRRGARRAGARAAASLTYELQDIARELRRYLELARGRPGRGWRRSRSAWSSSRG